MAQWLQIVYQCGDGGRFRPGGVLMALPGRLREGLQMCQ